MNKRVLVTVCVEVRPDDGPPDTWDWPTLLDAPASLVSWEDAPEAEDAEIKGK